MFFGAGLFPCCPCSRGVASEKSLRWLPRPFLPTWHLGCGSILCLLESLLGSELPGCYFPLSSSASPLVHAQLARDRRKSPAGFGIPSSGFPLSFPRHGQPQTPRLSSWQRPLSTSASPPQEPGGKRSQEKPSLSAEPTAALPAFKDSTSASSLHRRPVSDFQ